MPQIHPKYTSFLRRKCTATASQTRPFCTEKALQTHPFNAANTPQKRPKDIAEASVLRRKSTHKHTRSMPLKIHERRPFNKQKCPPINCTTNMKFTFLRRKHASFMPQIHVHPKYASFLRRKCTANASQTLPFCAVNTPQTHGK